MLIHHEDHCLLGSDTSTLKSIERQPARSSETSKNVFKYHWLTFIRNPDHYNHLSYVFSEKHGLNCYMLLRKLSCFNG